MTLNHVNHARRITMKDISYAIKKGEIKAMPINLPFIIERLIDTRHYGEPEDSSVLDLIMEYASSHGLEKKADAFSLNETISAAILNTHRVKEFHAVQLYKILKN